MIRSHQVMGPTPDVIRELVAGLGPLCRERQQAASHRAHVAGRWASAPKHKLVFVDRLPAALVHLRPVPHTRPASCFGVVRSTTRMQSAGFGRGWRGAAAPSRPGIRLRTPAEVIDHLGSRWTDRDHRRTEIRVCRPAAGRGCASTPQRRTPAGNAGRPSSPCPRARCGECPSTPMSRMRAGRPERVRRRPPDSE